MRLGAKRLGAKMNAPHRFSALRNVKDMVRPKMNGFISLES
jgi:hypothetical protein